MTDSELRHTLALLAVSGIGPVSAKNLIAHAGSAEGVFQLPRGKLMTVHGIGPKAAEALLSGKAHALAERELERLRQQGIEALGRTDAAYPEYLKTIYDAPLLLYKQGAADLNAQPNIAIVGTRKPTNYGLGVAAQFARFFATAGCNVVSGMAYGIDIAAHRAVLEAGGISTGVLGHGLHYIYPPEHRATARQLTERGALLTEYFWGQNALAKHFPQRNRILAGICQAVVVIEAAEKGGALITARLGFEQNREIFAVPGNLGQESSAGCNRIIRDQMARLVTSPEEVLGEIAADLNAPAASNGQTLPAPAPGGAPKPAFTPATEPLTTLEQQLLNYLEESPQLIDLLVEKTGRPAGELMGVLLALEFRGLVEQHPGRKFVRI